MVKEHWTAVISLGRSPHLIQKSKDIVIETYLSSVEERFLDIA